jgi:subtilisin family serine protease
VHGTWVAGLIADGAPWTRLSLLNLYPFGDQPQPLRFEEADAEQFARRLQDAAPRLRGSGVRVVNMSWGLNADAVAQLLLITGAETDEEQARVRGRALAATVRSAFEQLLVDCPDILFVAAAGNTDQTTDIAETIPQTLDSPNLLVVGATGRSGQPTAFTSYGEGVRLYALGEAVQVRAPGGQIMTASGTSFASPLTARAAAAMLAANPALTPAQVIEGLTATARPAADADLPLLDPRGALRWAEARR